MLFAVSRSSEMSHLLTDLCRAACKPLGTVACQVIREVQQPEGDVRKLLDVVQSDMLRNLANMTNPCVEDFLSVSLADQRLTLSASFGHLGLLL